MKKCLSFLTLNIGNPSLERAQKQCRWLENREEDVFVLTETKASHGCQYIEDYFFQYGYDLFSMNSPINFAVMQIPAQWRELSKMSGVLVPT